MDNFKEIFFLPILLSDVVENNADEKDESAFAICVQVAGEKIFDRRMPSQELLKILSIFYYFLL